MSLQAIAVALMVGGAATIAASGWAMLERSGKLKVVAEYANYRAKVAEAAREAEAKARVDEESMRLRVRGASREIQAEQERTARVRRELAAARTERDGLRDQIGAFARGDPSTDTAAACGQRAEALGALLDEALRAGEESAGDGESCEADKRGLLRAWPVNPSSVGPDSPAAARSAPDPRAAHEGTQR